MRLLVEFDSTALRVATGWWLAESAAGFTASRAAKWGDCTENVSQLFIDFMNIPSHFANVRDMYTPLGVSDVDLLLVDLELTAMFLERLLRC